MKKLLCLLTALICVSVCAVNAFAQEYMNTDSFDVDITVDKNNVYHVTETVSVDFNTYRHGIYRYIPYTFNVTREIGGEIKSDSCRVRIENIDVGGYNYETYSENGCKVIQIGDADYTVIGKQTYVISYTVRNRDDGIADFDDFYWNVLPHNWETPIASSKIKITFPKEADASKASLFAGGYGMSDENAFETEQSGNVFTATSKRVLKKGEGATARLVFPDKTFFDMERNRPLEFLMLLAMCMVFATVLILKIVFGRRKEVIPVISFNAPDGLTSADVGYVIDGITDTKDILSLIIWWANKGYITINAEKEDEIYINKVKELGQDAKPYEKSVFDTLFAEKKNSVSSKNISEKFLSEIQNAKLGVSLAFNLEPEKRIFRKSSTVSSAVTCILGAVPLTVFITLASRIRIVSDAVTVAGVIFGGLIVVINFLRYLYSCKKEVMSQVKKNVLNIILWAAEAAVTGAAVYIGINVLNMLSIAVVTAVMTLACSALLENMRAYTGQGEKIAGEVLGLRNFIKEAELDRLNALVENDPQYFYNILPFAYVLGLSDKWSKKFEKLAVPKPTWYSSPGYAVFNTRLFMRSFDSSMNRIQSSMITAAQKNSGGGFSSGGFSGGFSGGGGGGGGGGSW